MTHAGYVTAVFFAVLFGLIVVTGGVALGVVSKRILSAFHYAVDGSRAPAYYVDTVRIDNKLPLQDWSATYTPAQAAVAADVVARVKSAMFYGRPFVSVSHPGMSVLAELYFSRDKGLFGVIARDDVHRTLWIAFRGTETSADWKQNLNFNEIPLASTTWKASRLQVNMMPLQAHPDEQGLLPPIMVHGGFFGVYKSMRQNILDMVARYPQDKLVLTGHSLGAAVANVAALDIAWVRGRDSVACYAFAPPRAGNPQFAAELSKQTASFQIINQADLVPSLPATSMPNFQVPHEPVQYAHGGTLVVFDNRDNALCLSDTHSLAVYQSAVSSLENVSFIHKSTMF